MQIFIVSLASFVLLFQNNLERRRQLKGNSHLPHNKNFSFKGMCVAFGLSSQSV